MLLEQGYLKRLEVRTEMLMIFAIDFLSISLSGPSVLNGHSTRTHTSVWPSVSNFIGKCIPCYANINTAHPFGSLSLDVCGDPGAVAPTHHYMPRKNIAPLTQFTIMSCPRLLSGQR